MTAASAVLDASVLVRAGVESTTSARAWVESVDTGQTRAFAPELVWLETASALRHYVASGAMEPPHAFAVLGRLLGLPISVHSLEGLAQPALEQALKRGFSVYDASYVVLAEVADAVLVTADRRLAEAAERAELVV